MPLPFFLAFVFEPHPPLLLQRLLSLIQLFCSVEREAKKSFTLHGYCCVGADCTAADICVVCARPVYSVCPAHAGPATGVRFSPYNHLLMCTTGLDRTLKFFDVQDRTYALIAIAPCAATNCRCTTTCMAIAVLDSGIECECVLLMRTGNRMPLLVAQHGEGGGLWRARHCSLVYGRWRHRGDWNHRRYLSRTCVVATPHVCITCIRVPCSY